jgi:hypothetical protein
VPTTPLIQYASLAELFQFYCDTFVAQSPILSDCGCRIHCMEHHFVHVIALFGPNKQKLIFADERAAIIAQVNGFGTYMHEERRATRLLRFLKAVKHPEVVVRASHLKTADRVFIRHVDCSQYPFMAALVRKEKSGNLTLCTFDPLRGRNLPRWMTGEVLWTEDKMKAKNTTATG